MFIVSKGKKKGYFFLFRSEALQLTTIPKSHTLTVTSNAVIIIFDFRDEAKSDLPF